MKSFIKKCALGFLAVAFLGFAGTMAFRALYIQVIEEQKGYESGTLRSLEEKRQKEAASNIIKNADGSITVGLMPNTASREYLAALRRYDQYSDTAMKYQMSAFYSEQVGLGGLLFSAYLFAIHIIRARGRWSNQQPEPTR